MSTVSYRYEIIGAWNEGGYDLVEHEANKQAAFNVAAKHLEDHKEGDFDYMAVYDLMAHKGAVSGWEIRPDNKIIETSVG